MPETITPTLTWLKKDIVQWMIDHKIVLPNGIENFDKMTKPALIAEAKRLNLKVKYVIEDMADKSDKNIKVLWLPPAHCEFNAIELVWAFVKNHVSLKNTGGSINNILTLSLEAIEKVTPELWQNCIDHAIKYEDKMWDRDRLVDESVSFLHHNPLIIPVHNDDTTDSESCSDSDSDSELFDL
jgi:hypothetical protein